MIKCRINVEKFSKRLKQKYEPMLAAQVARLCNPYVPFDTGALKNSARVVGSSVWYPTPYARRQYYEHKGDGERGARWERRMMKAKGAELTATMQRLLGKG